MFNPYIYGIKIFNIYPTVFNDIQCAFFSSMCCRSSELRKSWLSTISCLFIDLNSFCLSAFIPNPCSAISLLNRFTWAMRCFNLPSCLQFVLCIKFSNPRFYIICLSLFNCFLLLSINVIYVHIFSKTSFT